MIDLRLKKEMEHVRRVKSILDKDRVLPLRLHVEERTLDHREFIVTLTGIKSLTGHPGRSLSPIATRFLASFVIQQGYPWRAIPEIRFQAPVPFHPHVFPSGNICWGKEFKKSQPSLALADWIRGLVEYLQYNQEPGGFLVIDPKDPANREARDWWVAQGRQIHRYVTPIDMARLRFWIDQTRV